MQPRLLKMFKPKPAYYVIQLMFGTLLCTWERFLLVHVTGDNGDY